MNTHKAKAMGKKTKIAGKAAKISVKVKGAISGVVKSVRKVKIASHVSGFAKKARKIKIKNHFAVLAKRVRKVKVSNPFAGVVKRARKVKITNPFAAVAERVQEIRIVNPIPAIAKRARKIKIGKFKVANLFSFALAILMLSVMVSAVPMAAGDVTISADNKYIEIESSASAGVALTVTNNYAGTACVELRTESDYDGVYAVLPKGEFCLAENQSTKFAMAINAKDWAEEGKYVINVIMKYSAAEGEWGGETEVQGTFKRTMSIAVKVTGTGIGSGGDTGAFEGKISILPKQDSEFCKDAYAKQIPVYIQNNTSREQHITLSAVSEMFLPSFNEHELWLGAGERKEVELKININRTTAKGYYYIPLYAQAERASSGRAEVYAESTVGFSVTECGEGKDRPFELSVDAVKYDVAKGAQVSIGFTVKNLLGEKQEIRLSSTGDIPNSLKRYSITLEGFETYRGKISVGARDSDKAGWHEIALYAWNENGKENEFVQVNVGRMHDIEVKVLNNNLEQRACSADGFEVFEIVFKNNGDYGENISLEIENPYDTISYDISDDDFELGSGESRSVYVSVVPGYDAELADYEITLRVRAGGGYNEHYALKFRVIEAGNGAENGAEYAEKTAGVLEISGYAGNVSLKAGSEKNLKFTVKNNSAETIGMVKVKIWGIDNGNGVYFPTLYIESLAPWESVTVSGKIAASDSALPKEYAVTVEATSDKYVATAKMRVSVESVSGTAAGSAGNSQGSGGNSNIPAGIAGFLNLANSGFAVLGNFANPSILGAGLVILMLLTIIYFVLLLGSNKKAGYGLPRRIMARAR